MAIRELKPIFAPTRVSETPAEGAENAEYIKTIKKEK